MDLTKENNGNGQHIPDADKEDKAGVNVGQLLNKYAPQVNTISGNFLDRYAWQNKLLVLGFIVFAISNLAWWKHSDTLSDQLATQPIYNITEDGMFIARRAGNYKFETVDLKNYVTFFMEHMYAYKADTYKKNVERALGLIDKKDGVEIVREFRQKQVEDQLVKASLDLQVKVDSVHLNMSKQPYYFEVYSTVTVKRPGMQHTQPIAARGRIRELTSKTDTNPFALEIFDFAYIPYPGFEESYNVDPDYQPDKQP